MKFRRLKIGIVNLLNMTFREEDINRANKIIEEAIKHFQKNLKVDVVKSYDYIDNFSKAIDTWKIFKSNDVDGVIIFNGTFTTGELTAEIIRNINCPILLWGIEEIPTASGYFSGSMVSSLASGAIFKNLDKKFSFVYGGLSQKPAEIKINIFMKTVRAISFLRESVIGLIGSRPDGFEISGYDELAIKKLFGTTLRKISMTEVGQYYDNVTVEEIDEDIKKVEVLFDNFDSSSNEVKNLSKIYIAIKKIVSDKKINAYAPECWPEFRETRKAPFCTANGRLCSEGIMNSCEADVDGALTMLLQYSISENTPWFADFYNYVNKNDTLLFWHCGNASYTLSKTKPSIEKFFSGCGLTQTSSLIEGEATVCRLNSSGGKFMIHAGAGQVIYEKPVIKGSNLFIRMNSGNENFVNSLVYNGIPHHNGIVYGDIIDELKEFANLMNIPIVIS